MKKLLIIAVLTLSPLVMAGCSPVLKAMGAVPKERPVSCLEEVKLQGDSIDLALAELDILNDQEWISADAADDALTAIEMADAANRRAKNFCVLDGMRPEGEEGEEKDVAEYAHRASLAISEAAGFLLDVNSIILAARQNRVISQQKE